MNYFKQEEFNRFIEENEVFGFFEEPITLKSGRQSHFYANFRNIVEDVYLTEILTDYLLAFVQEFNLRVDTFYGVPDGATKVGLITQYKWAKQSNDYKKKSHVLAMGRKTPKPHGQPKDKYFVGLPRGNVIVIEDVTTTGGSLLKNLADLKSAGVTVVGVVSLTNRMEKRDDGLSVAEAVKRAGYPFHYMSSALDILPRMYVKKQPGIEIGKKIEAEFEAYGVQPLRLVCP